MSLVALRAREVEDELLRIETLGLVFDFRDGAKKSLGYIFENEAAQARHGQSAAVRQFEAAYSPELVGGDVVFTDYEMVLGKRSEEQWLAGKAGSTPSASRSRKSAAPKKVAKAKKRSLR